MKFDERSKEPSKDEWYGGTIKNSDGRKTRNSKLITIFLLQCPRTIHHSPIINQFSSIVTPNTR